MRKPSQKGVLLAKIEELKQELEEIRAKIAVEFERKAKAREEKLVAEIVRLTGELKRRHER